MGDLLSLLRQVYATVFGLLQGHLPHERAQEVASKLSEGYWTHDYPICFDEARALGLPVSDAMPKAIYGLMDLYPQAGPRRPSVEFVPTPYRPPAPRPPGGRP